MEKVRSKRLSVCFNNEGDQDDQVDWEDFVCVQGKYLYLIFSRSLIHLYRK